MEHEIAIEVKDLHLKYRIFKKMSIKKQLFARLKNREEPLYFEALKGVTFSMEKGSIVGVIGKNGSGKSTLLNTIAGIYAPDEGSVNLNGNSVSLLSIGVGFQKELTGRENIKLSGMLLGFTEKMIDDKTDEIIAFAELDQFIDMPVKTYSSGMYSKLAFSITAILETDIILVDEVLSVGDMKFKKKSFNKMKEIITDDDKTVVIVSHSNDTIEELCDRVIWLHDGIIRMQGDPKEVLGAYKEFMS